MVDRTPTASRARAAAHLAEVLTSSATYVRGDDALAAKLRAAASSIPADVAGGLARIDRLFATDGRLHVISRRDGWEEEFLGLAAAYRVEAAVLR